MQKKHLLYLIASLISLNIIAQPTISSFAPVSGVVGTNVTITGTNYSTTKANNIVFFGAVKAVVSSATTTSLIVKVPPGATFQPITVTVNGLTGYSNKPFTVTFSGGGIGFSPKSFYLGANPLTGNAPQGINVSDIDGDGKPDLISANYTAGNFSVIRNTTTGFNLSFAPKIDFVSGSGTNDIAVGDIDGDGKLDVVIPNWNDNNISVFRNTSSPNSVSFASKINFTTGTSPHSAAIKDLDGDGKPDIAVSNYFSNSVSLFRNTSTIGAISFAAKMDFSLGLSPADLAIDDLDLDGKPDIAVACEFSSGIRILRNESFTGTFNFTAGYTQATGTQPQNLSIGDLDGDGKLDIAVANSSSNTNPPVYTVAVLKNISVPGDILFTEKIPFTTGYGPQDVTINDLDGDGKPDMEVSLFDGYISLFRNTCSAGNISFSTSVNTISTNPYRLSIADMDGDTQADIISPSLVSFRISVLKNKVNWPSIISFTPTLAESGQTDTITGLNFTGAVSVSFGGVAAASFSVLNNTTILATVGAGAAGDVKVVNQYGADSLAGFIFPAPPTITAFTPVKGVSGTTVTITGTQFSGATSVSFGGIPAQSFTINNSTSITAEVGVGKSGNVSVTTPLGTGFLAGFKYLGPVITSFTPTKAGTGDTVTITGFNLTGATAISLGGTPVASFIENSASKISAVVAGGSSGEISIITSNGSSSLNGFIFLSPPPPIITSFSPTSGTMGTSVIIKGNNFQTNPGNNIVYFGTAKAIVTSASENQLSVIVPAGSTFEPISVLNRVNHLIGYSNNAFVATFPHGGIINSNSFLERKDIEPNPEWYPSETELGDIDGDGKTDIVLGVFNRNAGIIRNISTIGSLAFSPIVQIPDFISPNITLGDIDGDGKLDIIGSNVNYNYISVARNISTPGNISFAPQVGFTIPAYPASIGIADIDCDGRVEIVVGNSGPNMIILRNTSTPHNISLASVIAIPTDGSSGTLCIKDLDGDHKQDIIILSGNNGTMEVFRNTGTPEVISFGPQVNYATGASPIIVSTADMNGDDKPDVVVSHTNFFSSFKNTSSVGVISFGVRTDYPPSPVSIHDFEIGDIDGDSKPDIVDALELSNTGSIGIYKNNSTDSISFAPPVMFSDGVPWSVDIADMDGDGKPDIPAAYPDWHLASILKNRVNVPLITSFSPEFGTSGTSIEINGDNFTGTTLVSFGGVAAQSFKVKSPAKIIAVVGAGASGDIRVISPAGTTMKSGFNYFTLPSIASFSPTSTTTDSIVTIYGKNFTGTTAVSFGGVPAKSFNQKSDTKIMAVVAGGTSGNVSVTNPIGTDTLSGFTFLLPPPKINSFSPSLGTKGTSVTITGINFLETNAVSFGGVPAASFVVHDPGNITAVVGEGASGDISITTPYGIAKSGSFAFYPLPVITSFTPTIGGAGTRMTIEGKNFANVVNVFIGGVPVADIHYGTLSKFSVIVGSGASGSVKVVTEAGGIATLPGFTFIKAPVIKSFMPTSASSGDTITITGSNFSRTTSVNFGGVAASSFNVVDSTTITAVVGAGASGTVSVTTPGGTANLPGFGFIAFAFVP